MKVLALDPGALRMGWACVSHTDNQYTLIASGVYGLERPEGEAFQLYRRRLIAHWCRHFPIWLEQLEPDQVVSEVIPAVGGGNFVAATQSELAKTVVTTCQVIAHFKDVPWGEWAANTVKKNLTGSGKATKVAVRNAVISVFPELEPRKKELTEVADESDAIGIALVAMGYKYGKTPRLAGSA